MGDKEVLMQTIQKSCDKIEAAQDAAAKTERPKNACLAHDAQFSLSQALCDGVFTLLKIKLDDMKKPEVADKDVDGKLGQFLVVARVLSPWRWPVALIALSPKAPVLLEKLIAVFC